MGDVIVLRSIPIDLNSDRGHQFIVDRTRAAEGLITDKELQEKYELSPPDWGNITKDTALIRAIQAERERRVRSGTAAREMAQKHFIKAPGILDGIMTNEAAPARHRIEAIKELRQTAIPDNAATQPGSEKFIIQINLNGDVERYEKTIAIDAADGGSPNKPKSLENAPNADE
jgi:hypothetical protein